MGDVSMCSVDVVFQHQRPSEIFATDFLLVHDHEKNDQTYSILQDFYAQKQFMILDYICVFDMTSDLVNRSFEADRKSFQTETKQEAELYRCVFNFGIYVQSCKNNSLESESLSNRYQNTPDEVAISTKSSWNK